MRFCVDLWCVGICLECARKPTRTEIDHTWPPTPPPDLSETLPTMHASTDALASAHHQALHAPAGVGELATLDHFKTPTSYVYGGDSGLDTGHVTGIYPVAIETFTNSTSIEKSRCPFHHRHRYHLRRPRRPAMVT